jgi:UDP-glucose:(heptosyl)LPS alpha-1,3-glucosyltransferase
MQPDSDNERTPVACDVTIVAHDIGPVGGMERQIVQLLLGLRRRGHRVTVIARTCELPPDSGVEFHRVPGPARPFLVAYPWFLALGSLIVRRRARGVVQATGAIVLGRVDTIAIHYCHQIGVTTSSRSTASGRAYIRLVGALSRIGERVCFGINRSALFVCVSDGVADEVREHFPAAADRVLTIHNGVDTEAFAPGARADEAASLRASLGVAPTRLLAAFVGSEWERKGLGAAIRALAGAPSWDLVVAGGGDEEAYRELARSLGVEGSIHWLGVTRDVPLVYEMANALVFPSSYEAFPLVILEAAASGLAILTTPVNGVRELLSDGESGLLISQEPSVIAERLELLAEDRELRERIGKGAREAVLRFSWERMVDSHHELYERLAEERPS